MKTFNQVTNIYNWGGVKFHLSDSEHPQNKLDTSKRTTAQLLALLLVFLLPCTFSSCVNDIPGYNESDDYSTRQHTDTTAQDSIDGFDGNIDDWNDGGEIGTDTIYRIK